MTDERDDELIAAWMQEFAALPLEKSSLPDPAYLWWKAQLLRRWDAQRTVVAPLEWGERVQVATGLGGAVVLLALSWPHVPIVATGVLVLTAAVAAGWWRQSLTSD
ncbi:MAG: hypothetical protein AUH72_19620 [Acidobacteria bacterium 13_1_40CM_4_65_8]|jgi:hypothetical protein|nr:MAG: hypothetical protein AUH72_19620 [Acidobacteria bacterium 13_1_40CM_4_65_8]OLE81304.1 MAG: hypothetical protein AUF76_13255 [Acidobacteria bacterium 13_1_20CM_2_65_9]